MILFLPRSIKLTTTLVNGTLEEALEEEADGELVKKQEKESKSDKELPREMEGSNY
jgi:hypothetical protein